MSPESVPLLFTTLKKGNHLDRLEALRMICAERFLLTEPLWIEWLQDWSTMDAQSLLDLHTMSVQMGQSIKLWNMFLDFLESHGPHLGSMTPETIDGLFQTAAEITAYDLNEVRLNKEAREA
jgi:hypothetical protein